MFETNKLIGRLFRNLPIEAILSKGVLTGMFDAILFAITGDNFILLDDNIIANCKLLVGPTLFNWLGENIAIIA